MKNKINDIVNKMLLDYDDDRVINNIDIKDQPDTDVIIDMTDKMINILFPGFFNDKKYHFYNSKSQLTMLIEDVMYNLVCQITLALKQDAEYADMSPEKIETKATDIAEAFFNEIPKVRALLETDVRAAFDGDPAAFNKNEIILCYPGYYAIAINRMAHVLYQLKVPLIPRIMTEYGHSETGVDIHPGATIGEYFFIDHATGIVIGETTEIGSHVKIYQGVTLGGLSTRGGQSLKNVKRHPTIEDDVTIYAGASILGGKTVIGA
ncbi:MAG: serine acetyltransferase, partial [Erysipelotrichaceae bacterium]|nr:serine acetyltransferase [Erysipelotrichaceae bacterium]